MINTVQRFKYPIVVVLLLFLLVPALIPLIRPGFYPTQDFIHVGRMYEMNRSLSDGQFPVRWVADFRYGEPLFNFYAPLPYYLGSWIHDLGLGYIDTTKLLSGLSIIFSAFTMFMLVRKLMSPLSGFISALLYVYAPYHSVDIYVRGALSEGWALVFFPLIFLTSFNLSKDKNIKNLFCLSLSLAGLFYTHNIMTLIFAPFLAGWIIYLLFLRKDIKLLGLLIVSILLGFGLAASFLLPAFFEKPYVQSDKLITGYFNFRGHFVEIRQFFSTFWGYGASLWGSEDGMSFQIGVVHWLMLLLGLAVALINKNKFYLSLIGFLVMEFLFSLFMQHNRSTPIWEAIPLLSYIQFPWRFLGISIFLVSIIGGIVPFYLLKLPWIKSGKFFPPSFKAVFIILILIGSLLVANINYFHPESYYLDSIDAHYTTDILSVDDKLPKDYLPIWVKNIDKEKKLYKPRVISGNMEIDGFSKNSYMGKFNANVNGEGVVEIPISYFPGWEVYANGKILTQEKSSDLGLIQVKLTKGLYNINVKFTDTTIRTLGNIISGTALLIIAGLFVIKKKRFKLL